MLRVLFFLFRLFVHPLPAAFWCSFRLFHHAARRTQVDRHDFTSMIAMCWWFICFVCELALMKISLRSPLPLVRSIFR